MGNCWYLYSLFQNVTLKLLGYVATMAVESSIRLQLQNSLDSFITSRTPLAVDDAVNDSLTVSHLITTIRRFLYALHISRDAIVLRSIARLMCRRSRRHPAERLVTTALYSFATMYVKLLLRLSPMYLFLDSVNACFDFLIGLVAKSGLS